MITKLGEIAKRKECKTRIKRDDIQYVLLGCSVQIGWNRDKFMMNIQWVTTAKHFGRPLRLVSIIKIPGLNVFGFELKHQKMSEN